MLWLLGCGGKLLTPVTGVADVQLPEGDVERGRYLGEELLRCDVCHAADLGGRMMVDGFPMGRIVAPDLTGGIAPSVVALAVREGISSSGTPTVMMPATYAALSDQELADLTAWMAALPAVERELPSVQELGPVSAMLLKKGAWAFGPHARRDVADEGERLAGLACAGCHGEGLHGHSMGPEGYASDLTVLDGWSRADFIGAVVGGVAPGGRALSEVMPRFDGLAEEDLERISAYVLSL